MVNNYLETDHKSYRVAREVLQRGVEMIFKESKVDSILSNGIYR